MTNESIDIEDTIVIKQFEDGIFDPVKNLTEEELQQIKNQWLELNEGGIVRFQKLEVALDKKKEEKIETFKLNAKKKMERHPSKTQIVNKVLESSSKTLERQNRLQYSRLRRLLKVVRKLDGDSDSILDDMTEEEFTITMALRIAEKNYGKDAPRQKHIQEKLDKTKESLGRLNKYINMKKPPST